MTESQEQQPETPRNNGQFIPGRSGNPNGSSRKQRERYELIRDLLLKEVPAEVAIEALGKAVKDGLPWAHSIYWERVLPALRPVELAVPIDLPLDGSLTDQSRAVSRALQEGELTPAQAQQAQMGLSASASVIKLDEIVRRLDALESRGRPKLLSNG
jgi:hypothetical protein